MDLRRSQHIPKPRTIWEAKGAPCAVNDPKVTKNTVRTEQQTAFKPIPVDSFPKTFEINENQLLELSKYESLLNLQFQRSKSLVTDLSQLNTFHQLLTSVIINKIVKLTNNYTENVRNMNFNKEDPKFFFRF